MLVDEDPQRALEHARFARQRASRIAVVREAAGITAYHAGEWAEALGELRAARRMGGGPGHLPVMADIERALGRPERALELTRSPEVRELGRAESIELAIVAAGARRDLGELDVAVVGLQIPELDPARREPWSARLFYAYADNLLAASREAEALQLVRARRRRRRRRRHRRRPPDRRADRRAAARRGPSSSTPRTSGRPTRSTSRTRHRSRRRRELVGAARQAVP